MSLFSKIRGTIETIFQIGLGGPNLKANSGVIEGRNAADSAFAVIRGGTPAAGNDLTTKTYVDSGDTAAISAAESYADSHDATTLSTAEAYTDAAVATISVAGVVREIRLVTDNTASQSSATSIPANAVGITAQLKVTTPYSAGATIALGRTGSTALFMATTDNDPLTANIYEVDQDTAFGASALPLLVTVGGAPAAGAGVAIIRYTVPNV